MGKENLRGISPYGIQSNRQHPPCTIPRNKSCAKRKAFCLKSTSFRVGGSTSQELRSLFGFVTAHM